MSSGDSNRGSDCGEAATERRTLSRLRVIRERDEVLEEEALSRVLLQPQAYPHARQHYADTIDTPVTQDRLAMHLGSEDMSVIRAIYGLGPVPVWGVTSGGRDVNRKKWEKVAHGDIVLMARDQIIFASAMVTFKTHNEALASDLWGRDAAGSNVGVPLLPHASQGTVPA